MSPRIRRMMNPVTMGLAASGVVLVAACSVTPDRAPDEPYRYTSARTPYSAAICIARNGRDQGRTDAEERTLDASAWEVVVRSRGNTLAVAEVRGDGVGSRIVIRMTPAVTGDREGFGRRLVNGC